MRWFQVSKSLGGAIIRGSCQNKRRTPPILPPLEKVMRRRLSNRTVKLWTFTSVTRPYPLDKSYTLSCSCKTTPSSSIMIYTLYSLSYRQYRIIKMKILRKIHDAITFYMSKSWIVEHILIAKVTEKEGGALVTYDCIYCTILRNAVIFFAIGLIVGLCI